MSCQAELEPHDHAADGRPHTNDVLARRLFLGRGFSDDTVHALVAAGLDSPERLLVLSGTAVARLAGLCAGGRAEVESYRRRYARAMAG